MLRTLTECRRGRCTGGQCVLRTLTECRRGRCTGGQCVLRTLTECRRGVLYRGTVCVEDTNRV